MESDSSSSAFSIEAQIMFSASFLHLSFSDLEHISLKTLKEMVEIKHRMFGGKDDSPSQSDIDSYFENF